MVMATSLILVFRHCSGEGIMSDSIWRIALQMAWSITGSMGGGVVVGCGRWLLASALWAALGSGLSGSVRLARRGLNVSGSGGLYIGL